MEKKRIGLYRDDSLGWFDNTSCPEPERENIVSETNHKVVNFLDLTLNLSTGKYKPYKKPDNKPLYINVNSNHPPNIIKNLLESIS